MAAYEKPNNYFPGENYNSFSFVSLPENVAYTNKQNNFELLQSCGAIMPSYTDSSSVIPTTAWVQGMVIENTETVVRTNESNIFTELQYCTATMPSASDDSTVMPTSAFVQSAIQSNELDFLDTANTFSATQSCSSTMPNDTDASNIIPNTSWTQSAITNSLVPFVSLSTNQTITGDKAFSGTNTAITNGNASDNSTEIATDQFVQNAVQSNQTTFLNSANTYTQLQSCSASMPPSNDSGTTLVSSSWVQSAIDGSSNDNSITIGSVYPSTQINFEFFVTVLTGNFYSFYLYSQNPMNAQPTVTGSGDLTGMPGFINSVSGGLLASGVVSRTNFTQVSQGITYCNGYQEDYSWENTTGCYVPQFTTVQGNGISNLRCYVGSTKENNSTCPPSAGTPAASYIIFDLDTAITSQYLYFKFIPVE